jgi:hypothetical protein
MLICFHSPGGAALGSGWSGDEHAAIGRGQHQVRVLRRDAIGIAKKYRKKAARNKSGTAPREPTVRAAATARTAVPPMNG